MSSISLAVWDCYWSNAIRPRVSHGLPFLIDGSLSDTALTSMDALERQRNQRQDPRGLRSGAGTSPSGGGGGGGGGGTGGGAGNSGGGPGVGMGKKSSSTSQLSAAGRCFESNVPCQTVGCLVLPDHAVMLQCLSHLKPKKALNQPIIRNFV